MATKPTNAQIGATSHRPSVYRMCRYVWRSIMTATSPLLILGFYTYIVKQFLLRPPVNDMVLSGDIQGNWVFCIWFVLSVLMLDWARAGLANIEAYALMFQKVAPSTSLGLMWHADQSWSNPIWWLRALWYYGLGLLSKRSRRSGLKRHPGRLWMLFATIILFLFVAVPLSGLTLQTTQIYTKSDGPTDILGPSSETLGTRNAVQSSLIRASWQAGRKTTPRKSALLSAPRGTNDVS